VSEDLRGVGRMKILLMGNPNVGKSVVFSRLTGVNVVSSNYPGTTVEFTKGKARIGGKKAEIIDVPGTYSLEPTSKAEEVARDMLIEENPDIVIDVVDATALERNLYLALQLLEHEAPVIVALNMWDAAERKGITIDVEALSEILGVPVVPTVAVTGEGIKQLVDTLSDSDTETGSFQTREELSDNEKWKYIGEITKKVQKIEHKHPSLLERLEDASIRPLTGIVIAVLVIYVSFTVVRFMGEGLISLLEPLFENYYGPAIVRVVEEAFPSGLVHDLLIGTTPDFVESFGLLTTGLFVPIVMVLPYVLSFYVMLGILEDVGYLPRLAVLVDNLMHKLGLHGSSIICMILGLGCNVPGVLSTRILETRRERFIAVTLMAVTVPCMAQNAVIIGLLGRYGSVYLGVVYGTLFAVYLVIGLFLNRILKGESPELFLEIPDYHIPNIEVLLKKTWMRIRGFIMEAVPFVLFGVFIVNVLYILGVIDSLANFFAPVLEQLLGLPKDAIVALMIGFLRKDMAVGMLEPLNLLPQQLVVACTVLTLYFPCIATFAVLLRELGVWDTLRAVGVMLVTAVTVGVLLRYALELII
jgi:ferrous iron transport protein B